MEVMGTTACSNLVMETLPRDLLLGLGEGLGLSR